MVQGEKRCHSSRPGKGVEMRAGIFGQASRAVIKISEPKDGPDSVLAW